MYKKAKNLKATNNLVILMEELDKYHFQRDFERDDFMEDPPKVFRLSPGKEVRLKYAYYIKCNEVIKNEKGKITQIHCTYDPQTKSGNYQIKEK